MALLQPGGFGVGGVGAGGVAVPAPQRALTRNQRLTGPELGLQRGAILAGITRDSVLTLLRSWGLRVSERPVSIDEVTAAASAGNLEMWGTGTAAVISPVGELGYKGERYVINGGQTGALTQKLYDTIVGIQYGTAPDPFGWTRLLGNRLGG